MLFDADGNHLFFFSGVSALSCDLGVGLPCEMQQFASGFDRRIWFL